MLPHPITYYRRNKTHIEYNPNLPLPQPASEYGHGTNSDLNELDIPIALRKGSRACTKHPISNFLGYSHLSKPLQALLTQLSEVTVPKTIDEALKTAKWRKVVLEEMKALESNGTWDVVQQPEGTKVVGCKWVFTIKYKADGSIGRYKTRLVAKGYM